MRSRITEPRMAKPIIAVISRSILKCMAGVPEARTVSDPSQIRFRLMARLERWTVIEPDLRVAKLTMMYIRRLLYGIRVRRAH